MKKLLPLFCFALILSGCATFNPPWPIDEYRTVKKCRNKDKTLKISFLLPKQNEVRENSIFTDELTVRTELDHENYGKVVIWLYYEKMEAGKERTFPEHLPEKIEVQTIFGKRKEEAANYQDLWKKFMKTEYLTLIENCVYGF